MLDSRHKTGRAKEGHKLRIDSESCKKGQLSSDVNETESVGEKVKFSRKDDTLGGIKKKYLLVVSLVVIATPLIASCSSSSATKDTTAVMSLTPVSTLIDVRSAPEFAEGHVQGATNLDLEGGAFEAALSGLDKDASYSLYCRSGRRSALAADLMTKAGFTKVTDLGSVESAATSLSLPIITN